MSPADTLAQASLIARCHAGDSLAIGELYDATVKQVYGYAFRLAGNVPDAEDITAETYERALKGIQEEVSKGVQFIRTHIDVDDPKLTGLKAMPVRHRRGQARQLPGAGRQYAL